MKKQYQKKINVKKHVITKEWKPLWEMFKLLPKDLRYFEIACAEGFPMWMAKRRGISDVKGIEIHKDKVESGRNNLNLGQDIMHGDIFERLGLIKKANLFIVCRFWHNISWEECLKIMNEIDKKRDYIIISKYKPGMFKENGKPRQPLATKKGLSRLFDVYNLKGKSFSQQFLVVAKGKFKGIPDMLREHLPEG